MDTFAEVRTFATHLESGRTAREEEWRDLARWICPYRGVFTGEDLAPRATRRNRNAFDVAATQALLRGASGMTSGMTPRNIAWFKPTFDDDRLLEASGARVWLDVVDRRMKSTLADGGFYQAIQSFNTDLLWAGCALLYSETGNRAALRFQGVPIGTFSVALDSDGLLDAVVRTMTWTPAQIAATFGKDRMAGSRDKLEHQPYESVRVTHCVRRRNFRDPQKRDKRNLPWESFFWEDDSEDFLSEGGYHEMPYFFTAWHEGQTVYGTGPGDEALPDAKMIHTLERNKLRGMDMLVNPPVQHPYMLKGRMNLEPGGMNPVTEKVLITPIFDMSPFASVLPHLQQEIQNVGLRLEKELMASIFASMPLDQRPREMSATEFLERKREALQQLGPVISAYEPNVLTPLLARTAATLDRQGLLPPPPPSLNGIPLLVKMAFVSPMANALRQTGAETTRALLADVGMLAQMQPDVLDKVDLDQTVDELATGLGVPGSVIRADSDVEQLRQQRAQQQAQQQQMLMAAQQAATAATQARGAADAASALHALGQPAANEKT